MPLKVLNVVKYMYISVLDVSHYVLIMLCNLCYDS